MFVKDVDLEAMPTSIFLKDDDDDDEKSASNFDRSFVVIDSIAVTLITKSDQIGPSRTYTLPNRTLVKF